MNTKLTVELLHKTVDLKFRWMLFCYKEYRNKAHRNIVTKDTNDLQVINNLQEISSSGRCTDLKCFFHCTRFVLTQGCQLPHPHVFDFHSHRFRLSSQTRSAGHARLSWSMPLEHVTYTLHPAHDW